MTSGPPSQKVPWRRGLHGWKEHGLEVDYAIGTTVAGSPCSRNVTVRLTNRGQAPLLNIRPEQGTHFERVPQIDPQKSTELVLHLDCSLGRESKLLLSLVFLAPLATGTDVSQETRASLEIRPTVGDLVNPDRLTTEQFLAEEQGLGGMFAQESTFSVGRQSASENGGVVNVSYWALEVKKRVLATANFAVVGAMPSEPILVGKPAYFCGRLCGSNERVLLKVSLSPPDQTGVTAVLRLACEDTLSGANLVRQLRACMLE